MWMEALRAQLQAEDSRQDARLRAILAPPKQHVRKLPSAWPMGIKPFALKPMEHRRLRAEVLDRRAAKRRRKGN